MFSWHCVNKGTTQGSIGGPYLFHLFIIDLNIGSNPMTHHIKHVNDNTIQGAVVAQLASVRLSEREVSGSIFRDLNVCFDFPLIRVAIALNTRKTEH